MEKVTLRDKNFRLFISNEKLISSISSLAKKINSDYRSKHTLFICVLNGSFMFASELISQFVHNCEVSFVKFASYDGVSSSGRVSELIGINEDLNKKDIIIIEDIVDTGLTIKKVVDHVSNFNPNSIEIATMLFKPKAYKEKIPLKYKAINVGNEFLVGFGLDYNGLGRNLEGIYILD
tara:strand:- start:3044 stop:3577 length:534 start_codon:yes stop_codon:yes gene_type:complete